MLQPGAKAPEFVLPDDRGGETTLSDLLQNGPLILYFYPADFTPGCTKEACSIRDIHNDIGDRNLFRDQGQVLIHSNFITDSVV